MDAERYADYMYNLIDRVINEIGPREACSAEEKRTGRLFAEEIKPACDRINVETFTCSPKAFLGFFPFSTSFRAGVPQCSQSSSWGSRSPTWGKG